MICVLSVVVVCASCCLLYSLPDVRYMAHAVNQQCLTHVIQCSGVVDIIVADLCAALYGSFVNLVMMCIWIPISIILRRHWLFRVNVYGMLLSLMFSLVYRYSLRYQILKAIVSLVLVVSLLLLSLSIVTYLINGVGYFTWLEIQLIHTNQKLVLCDLAGLMSPVVICNRLWITHKFTKTIDHIKRS